MTDPVIDNKTLKSRAKRARFVLYAAILLALLLWLWHDNREREAAETAAIEANLTQQTEMAIKKSRTDAAFDLTKKAAASQGNVEKIRIYDEIIDTYQDDPTPLLRRYVAWAEYKKALAVTDTADKSRLMEAVIDKYCDAQDKEITGYVRAVLREKLRMTGDDGAARIAVCESILEKQGGRLPDSLAAWLLSEKAEATSKPADQIYIYDLMLTRFLSSTDDSAFDLAVIAALDKMELISDRAEQIRLCDIAIEAFLKTPQRTRYYLFDTAIKKKAELAGDPALPLRLWNQVIANNVTEDSVVQARSQRMFLLKGDNEKLAACDEFIAAHQGSKSDFVQLMVTRAMADKANLLTDREAKVALWRSVIEKCAHIEDSRAKELANWTVSKLAEFTGDTSSAALYYDQEAARSENEYDALRALSSKARLVKGSAEEIKLYDEIIARGGNSSDSLVSREVTEALLEKVRLTDDREEKIKLYDELISRNRKSRDKREQARVARFMLDKAELLDGREARIGLYDEIISSLLNSGQKEKQMNAARAMIEKAKLSDDREEKIKLYDAVLFDMPYIYDDLFFFIFPKILRERAELGDGVDEKLNFYDRYLSSASDSVLDPEKRISLLLDKAELMSDPADKSRLYDETIAYCEHKLSDWDRNEFSRFSDYKRSLIFEHLGKTIMLKADLIESLEEKLELYDRYLAIPQTGRPDFMSPNFEKILSKRVELSGDLSIKADYFDRQIQAATTDGERASWYARKATAAETADRAAIDEEMIAKFFDNTEESVEKIVAEAFIRKIKRDPDSDEKIILCDRLIKRYGGDSDSRTLSMVAQAYILKAEAAKNDDTKLEIYSTVIDRYKNIDDYWVTSVVDKAIAAKFRLEMKKKEKM